LSSTLLSAMSRRVTGPSSTATVPTTSSAATFPRTLGRSNTLRAL
jgi:hypothetical protein